MPEDEADEVRTDEPDTSGFTADALQQGAENAPRSADDASGREARPANQGEDEQEPEEPSTGD